MQAEFCPAANLFCNDEHLAAWRTEAGDPPGQPATLAQLAGFGTRVWAEMRPGVTPARSPQNGKTSPDAKGRDDATAHRRTGGNRIAATAPRPVGRSARCATIAD